jgi:hypothetical protein
MGLYSSIGYSDFDLFSKSGLFMYFRIGRGILRPNTKCVFPFFQSLYCGFRIFVSNKYNKSLLKVKQKFTQNSYICYDDFISKGIFQKRCTGKKVRPKKPFLLEINFFGKAIFEYYFFVHFSSGNLLYFFDVNIRNP